MTETRDGWTMDPANNRVLVRGEYRLGVHDQYSPRGLSFGTRRFTLLRGSETVAQIRGIGLLDDKGQIEAVRKLKGMAK